MKIKDDIAYIPLRRGKNKNAKRRFVMIDAEEIPRVVQHKWYAYRNGLIWYARATSTKFLPQHHLRLHAFVMRAHPGERFDHVNGDGLDNRKCNLRLAGEKENARNTYKTNSPHVSSKFKGVHLSPSSDKWIAQITCDGVPQLLGLFDDEESAAHAYDEAAIRLFGEFAKTNEMMGLFAADVSNRVCDHPGEGKTAAVNQVLSQPPKPRWMSFLHGEPIQHSQSGRDRRRSPEALERRRQKQQARKQF